MSRSDVALIGRLEAAQRLESGIESLSNPASLTNFLLRNLLSPCNKAVVQGRCRRRAACLLHMQASFPMGWHADC